MGTDDFSSWARWSDRESLPGANLPGVYAVVISTDDLAGQLFSWRDDLVYIGMTNSQRGLSSRLRQFHNSIEGREGHGGAKRVRFKHQDFAVLEPALFVATHPFECDVRSNAAEDLRVMGQVAAFEYECLACYVEVHDRLPEFNDKKRSPKK